MLCPESDPASHHSPSDKEGTLSEPIELTALSLEVSTLSISDLLNEEDPLATPEHTLMFAELLLSSILIVYIPRIKKQTPQFR